MLKITPLGLNKTELHLKNGTIVFFSYKTPVAAYPNDGTGFIRTATKYSQTTSKHINQWLAGANAREVPQSFLDNLI